MIYHIYLPQEPDRKIGVDEYLFDHTIDELISLARPAAEAQAYQEPQRQSQAERLIKYLAEARPTLFHDETTEPFAKFKVKDRWEIWKIRSKMFKRYLAQLFWTNEKKALNNEALNEALNIIEAGACFNGKQYQLHVRVASYEDAIWYDLGDWRTVRIDKNDWAIVSDSPILFRRYSHQKPQVTPERCSVETANELFHFVNLVQPGNNEEHISGEQLLFLASLICGLIPDISHPLDIYHGVQGAAKTTIARTKKELLDPSIISTLAHPNSMVEFVQLASHHWIILLDNLSHLPEWLSDALCRVVTGDGFSKRELYTNDDDVVYSYRRCVSITGINLVATKPDLLDRGLIFELLPIPQKDRIEEQRFWRDFDEARPRILGALFALLSSTLREYPKVKLKEKPRMADFALYGCAVASALGLDPACFMKAYMSNITIQNQEAIAASPIAQVILNFMKDKSAWEGSPSTLLEELNRECEKLKIDVKSKNYPKDARWLWRRIKDVVINLQAEGIDARKDDSNHDRGRMIVLEHAALDDTENDVLNVRLEEKNNDDSEVRTDNTTDNILDTPLDPWELG